MKNKASRENYHNSASDFLGDVLLEALILIEHSPGSYCIGRRNSYQSNRSEFFLSNDNA